jgi:hypothetical protein
MTIANVIKAQAAIAYLISQGFGEDRPWQAKKEIRDATDKANKVP